MTYDIKIRSAEDADAIRERIESVVEGWYPPGTAMDWEDFLDRVEGSEYDLGESLHSEAIHRIKQIARELRKGDG